MSSLITPRYDIHINDTYRNHPQFRIDPEDKRALTQPLRSEIRNKLMEQLRQISYFFPHTIQEKYYFYTQQPNKQMASAFAKRYMDPLLVEAQKMDTTVAKVQKHFEKFEACLAQGSGLKLIQDMHQTCIKIDLHLIDLTTQYQGPEQEVHSFYVRCIHVFCSLKNMEKEMISCLEKTFNVPTRFKEDLLTFVDSIPLKNFDVPPPKNPNIKTAISYLRCPLTDKLFKYPVILETGHSIEQEELAAPPTRCPITGETLSSRSFIPNLSLESIAQRLAATKTQDTFFERMPAFTSPISGRLLQKPVVVSSGITYEEEEADELLAQNKNCPVMGVSLNPSIKIPNLALMQIMKALSGQLESQS